MDRNRIKMVERAGRSNWLIIGSISGPSKSVRKYGAEWQRERKSWLEQGRGIRGKSSRHRECLSTPEESKRSRWTHAQASLFSVSWVRRSLGVSEATGNRDGVSNPRRRRDRNNEPESVKASACWSALILYSQRSTIVYMTGWSIRRFEGDTSELVSPKRRLTMTCWTVGT